MSGAPGLQVFGRAGAKAGTASAKRLVGGALTSEPVTAAGARLEMLLDPFAISSRRDPVHVGRQDRLTLTTFAVARLSARTGHAAPAFSFDKRSNNIRR